MRAAWAATSLENWVTYGPGSIPTPSANGDYMEKIIVEIRAGEGGDDAKLLVEDQFVIYSKLVARRGL